MSWLRLCLVPFFLVTWSVAQGQTGATKSSPESSKKATAGTAQPVKPEAGKKSTKLKGKSPAGKSATSKSTTSGANLPSKSAKSPPAAVKSADDSTSNTSFGIGVVGGYEAIFGNGLVSSLQFNPNLGLVAGAGYSYSGLRIGVGTTFGFSLVDTLALSFGGVLAYSSGRKDDITFDAKFIPEGSTSEEAIVASREFELTAAQLFGLVVGGKLKLGIAQLGLFGNYNFVIGGNDVNFTSDVKFDRAIAPSNTQTFTDEFDRRAKELLLAGGPGGFISLEIIF